MTINHYIVIESHSGYVWEEADAETAHAACLAVDKKTNSPAEYEYTRTWNRDHGDAYLVYLAPAGWKPVEDGRLPEEIKRVEKTCHLAGVFEYRRISPEESAL